MVADDPFHEPPHRPPARDQAPSPILRITSDGDLLAHRVSQSFSHSNSPDAADSGSGGPSAPHLPAPPQAAVTAGTRTPRRVQWTQDHVINLAPLHTQESRDSQLNQSNIGDVNDALERFKTHRYRPSNLSESSMASLASSDASGEHHPHHLPHPLHRYPPPRRESHNDEDYDYRLDHDTEDEEKRFEDKLLDDGINLHMAMYVPPGERDGLPNIPAAASDPDAGSQAANLVRAHTSKWSTLRRRVQSGSVRRRDAGRDEYRRVDGAERGHEGQTVPTLTVTSEKPRHSDESTAVDHDHAPLRNAPLNPPLGADMPHFPGGTSVLSSLLALYGRHQHMDSGVTTPATSRPTSASNTPAGSDEELVEHEHEHEHEGKKHFWNRSRSPHPPPNSNDTDSPAERRRSSTSIADRRSPQPSPGLKGTFARAAHNWKQSDRPKAARSDAGVFGALIGTTGGLAASAAPGASTLIPAAKKPGFHLSRYSLPSSPAGGGHLSPPRSSHGSRPSSVYSTTVIADSPTDMGFDAKDENRTKSTDDLIMMKNRGKKPSALNLTALRGGEKRLKTPTEKRSFASEEDRKRKEWEAEKRRRKKAKDARKKQEVFIIQHVAAILARQQFLLKLARALMMFGSPTHRLETQIQATARVLEINAQVVYLPGTMLVSFGDDATHTSETKFLKQSTGLDLGKLLDVHNVYWNVVHDRVSVDEASKDLDTLMTSKPLYSSWQIVLISMCCSAFIVVPSFYGSFIDALMCAVLGGLLALVQIVAAKNDMFSNVFEIVIATLISFIAAVLSDTNKFCYTALVSGGVVLILPGFIVLTGALELASRNITAGAVRVGYAVIYSLFLGFGISIGGEIYFKIRHRSIKNADDWTCAATHTDDAPWYMAQPSGYWCEWQHGVSRRTC